MSLPTPWIDRIFDKLTLVYGQQFLRRWADIDLNAVKSDWGHELSGFERHPKAIAYALQNLPVDRPPTVLEFKRIANAAPEEEVKRLPPPKADPEVIARELLKMAPIRQEITVDRKEWARRLMARHSGGEKLRPISLRFAREALDVKAEA